MLVKYNVVKEDDIEEEDDAEEQVDVPSIEFKEVEQVVGYNVLDDHINNYIIKNYVDDNNDMVTNPFNIDFESDDTYVGLDE